MNADGEVDATCRPLIETNNRMVAATRAGSLPWQTGDNDVHRAAIVRRPSSDRATTANARRSGGDASDREEAKQRRSAVRGTREATARQPYMRWPAVGHRSATSGCVRARTRAHATRVRNDNVGLRTFINYWVGWTHPHPLRYC